MRPEYTRWKDGSAFRYQFGKERYADIHLAVFLSILKDKGKLEGLTPKALVRWRIEVADEDDNQQEEWSIYRCLYAEVEDDGSTFLLNNGQWYRIESDFLKEVSEEVATIPLLSINLPPYSDADEESYNLRVSNEQPHFCCMDQKTVELKKRGLTKIEFCDLYGLGKEIVHIKRYSGSSELSHLFQQGVVSAELFAHEAEFRELVNDKLPNSHKMSHPEEKLAPEDYKIVYGIISRSKSELALPFFSKIVLRNARRRLRDLGFEVRLGKIARADQATEEQKPGTG